MDNASASSNLGNDIDDIIKELSDFLIVKPANVSRLGLYDGLAGELLFHWIVQRQDKFSLNEDKFNVKLDALLTNISDVQSDFSLSRGISGIGWFLEFLNQDQGENYDPLFSEDIDAQINAILDVNHWDEEIEIVLGLAGVLTYLSRRQKFSNECSKMQSLALKHYMQLALSFDKNTLAWPQPKHSIFKFNKVNTDQNEFNYGLAHGMFGIVSALLPLFDIPHFKENSEHLITSACNWLISQGNTDQKDGFFTYSTEAIQTARKGWCYGDITSALILHRVGQATQNQDFISLSKKIALNTLTPSNLDKMVIDAGLCHGSAGLALLYHLLANEMKLTELESGREHWLTFTIERYKKDGLKGFYEYVPQSNKYQANHGLLTGYSGIGLCLYSIKYNDTSWTDSFLI